MTWVSLVLVVLKFINGIMDYVNREELIKTGYDRAIAEATQSILVKTAAGKAIMEKVNALSDEEVDADLRGLEPQ